MINIDSFLKNLELNNSFKKYAILLSSIMFIWSGFNKLPNFDKKVLTLHNKTNINENLCILGMILVILLEILGFFILIDYFFKLNLFYKTFNKFNIFIKLSYKQLIQIILLLTLLFLIVVTLIYHPLNFKKPIPFLSNLTTFGLFLYIYSDFENI